MSDKERNASDPVDEQTASETEDRDEQPDRALRQPADRGEELGVAAPADDDIIIK